MNKIPSLTQTTPFSPLRGNMRILYWIVGFYALWNPTPISFSKGLLLLAATTMNLEIQQEWKIVFILVLCAAALIVFAILWRRYNQAVSSSNIYMLCFYTLIVMFIVAIFIYVLYILKIVQLDDFGDYVKVFEWVWQIPCGFFIGKGLNWVFEDRRTAGFQGVQNLEPDHEQKAGHDGSM